MKTVKFSVPDMHCSNCVMALEALEDDLAGVQRVDASYRKQLVVVEFDDALLDETQIAEAIQKKHFTPHLLK